MIAILILTLWEGLVRAFDVQQFLLPRPSAIVANLVRVVIVDGSSPQPESGATERLLAHAVGGRRGAGCCAAPT